MALLSHPARTALVLLALAVALPAQAQDRFVRACEVSADGEGPRSRDLAPSLCRCMAARSIALGVTPPEVDEVGRYLPTSAPFGFQRVPAPRARTAEIVAGALGGCLVEGTQPVDRAEAELRAAVDRWEAIEAHREAMADPQPRPPRPVPEAFGGAPGGPATPPEAAPPASPDGTVASAPTTRTARAAAGVRTGAGAPVVRATQASRGAAIRIRQ